MEGGRRDVRRERMRAPALQRRHGGRGDPARVQGKAAVPVHASPVPEDRGMAARRAAGGPGELPAADRYLSAEETMSTAFEEKGPAHSGANSCSFRAEDVAASQEFRKQYETRRNV